MDPVSVIGLLSALAQLVDMTCKVTLGLNGIRSKYKSADLAIDLLIGQLTTLKAALGQITQWVSTSLTDLSSQGQLVEDLNTSTEGCRILMLVLEHYVEEQTRRDAKAMGVIRKVKYLFDEKTIGGYSEQLRNQVEALHLLLTAFHCRTVSEQLRILQDNGSRQIIRQVQEDTCSLKLLQASYSVSDLGSNHGEKDPADYDKRFDFDDEIVSAEAYRTALARLTLQESGTGISRKKGKRKNSTLLYPIMSSCEAVGPSQQTALLIPPNANETPCAVLDSAVQAVETATSIVSLDEIKDILKASMSAHDQSQQHLYRVEAMFQQVLSCLPHFQPLSKSPPQLSQSFHDVAEPFPGPDRGTVCSQDAIVPLSRLYHTLSTQDDQDKTLSKQKETALTTATSLRATRHRKNVCRFGCTCRCHKTTRLQTPRSWKGLLGLLLIGISGAPIYNRCDQHDCKRRSSPAVKLRYRFPAWLIYRMIFIAITLTPLDGPEFLLRTQRVVSPCSLIFRYARKGDTNGIKDLVSRGEASIYDMAEDDGVSALVYAVWYQNPEATKLLLDAGGDPYEGKWVMFTPIDLAFMMLHNSAENSPSEMDRKRAFQSIFDWEEYREEQQHTEIHRIVFGELDGDLEQALQDFPEKINDTDACGCTPLWWACTRGDAKSTELLLKYGADANICDVEGDYPLHSSILAGGSACTSLLLEYGDTVDKRNKFGRTAMRVLCHWRDDPDLIRVFLDHGADINRVDNSGMSPVYAAANVNATGILRLLLERDANLDLQGDDGLTALHVAIQSNSHDAVRAILEHQKCHTIVTNGQMTVLHMAASVGDAAMMKTLAQSGLQGPDVDAEDAKGFTARDYVQSRTDSSPELIEAFVTMEMALLLTQIPATEIDELTTDNQSLCEPSKYDHDVYESHVAPDIFVDAVENL